MYGVQVNATNAHEILAMMPPLFPPIPTHTVFLILFVVVYFYGFD